MYVVLGASGRAGSETAHALIELGRPVRVVLRRPEQAEKWTKLGVDVAFSSIEDVPSLSAALRDASGAFLLSPPPISGDPYRRADEVGSALAEAVRQAGLPKVVALSSVGAQHETGTGVIATLNSLEKHLEEAAPSTTFLRPGYFVETWGEVAPAVIADGVLASFLEPSQNIPMVSTIDVGRTAARLLSDDFSGKRRVELRGPQDWSANDVAAAFSRVLGRPVGRHSFRPRPVLRFSRRKGSPRKSPMRCSGCMTASPAVGSSTKKVLNSAAASLRWQTRSKGLCGEWERMLTDGPAA